SFAAFIALIAFALISVDTSAVAGFRHGCHGRRCHGRSHGLLHRRRNRCHGQQATACDSCESYECSSCTSGCSDCTSGCADGNCGGGSVIVEEAAPTEAAPKKAKKNKKKEAPAAPAKT
ncbi:MAG: hypothetical protein ABGW75_05725, partial [Pirellulales bacterium]